MLLLYHSFVLLSLDFFLFLLYNTHMTKHQKIFNTMLEENKDFFDNFKQLHDKYKDNQEAYRDEYNKEGEKALEIIRRYEQSLVAKSTTSQYAKFSGNLSDKYWEAVRNYFPMIDFIGVQTA